MKETHLYDHKQCNSVNNKIIQMHLLKIVRRRCRRTLWGDREDHSAAGWGLIKGDLT